MQRIGLWIFILVLMAACSGAPALPTVVPTSTLAPTATTAVVTATQRPASLPQLPVPQSSLRLLHAAPQNTAINIYLDRFLLAGNLAFGRATETITFDEGAYTLRALPADAAPDDTPLLEQPLTLRGGDDLVVVFTGTADALSIVTYPLENAPLGQLESRLSVIHAVPRGPDFTLQAAGIDLTPVISFGQISPAVIRVPDSAAFSFQAGQTRLLDYDLDLREGYSYTLVLVGRGDDLASLAVIALEERVPGRSFARFIHAAPEVGAVDVYVDGQLFAANGEYARPGERQEIASDTRQMMIYEAGADPAATTPLLSQSVQLARYANLALILTGPPGRLLLLPLVEDLSPTPPGQLRLALVNTGADEPVLRVVTINGALADVYYGQQAADVLLNAGTYTLAWNRIQNTTGDPAVEVAREIELEAGRYYLYLMTGALTPETPPVIFSESVGIEALSPVPSLEAAQVRFVNAVYDGLAVDFLVDGQIVASSAAYSQSTALQTLPEAATAPETMAARILTIRAAGTSEDLSTIQYTFDPAFTYSIFAYGSRAAPQINIVPDAAVPTNGQASLRLLNLSFNADVLLGLAYSEPVRGEGAVMPTDALRVTLPGGAAVALESVATRRPSPVIRLSSGRLDLWIVDADLAVGALVSGFTLSPDTHYDIVAFQEVESRRMRAFWLAYPPPAGQ